LHEADIMMDGKGLWRVEIAATAATVNAFEEALDPFCEAISWFVTDTEGDWRIEGFCEQKPNAADLAEAMATVAEIFAITVPEVTIVPVAPRDWVADSLRLFPPNRAGHYFIHGTHYETAPPPSTIAICLNPGRAFGSGEHATTRGCLLALDNLARGRRFSRPLDMGSGSGILAIAMARTWRVPVLAADNDVKTIAVARDNAKRNRVLPLIRNLRADGFSAAVAKAGPYDLICANILANPLCAMAADMARVLAPADKGGGIVVLSGFLIGDARRVHGAYARHGLRLIASYDVKGWRTLVLERPAVRDNTRASRGGP